MPNQTALWSLMPYIWHAQGCNSALRWIHSRVKNESQPLKPFFALGRACNTRSQRVVAVV